MATEGLGFYFQTQGTYGYKAGVTGSPVIHADARIQRVWCRGGTGGGTVTLGSREAVTVAESTEVTLLPGGAATAADLAPVFSGTSQYLVEYLT